MTSIDYKEIYSRFYSKVMAFDLAEKPNEMLNDITYEQIHSVISQPYIRRLFSSITYDDEIQEIHYEMKYVVDEDSDKSFVIDIIALGLTLKWLEPKLKTSVLTDPVFASKEEKWYSQANHLDTLQTLYESTKTEQRGMIRDRGYAQNSYLDGGKS